MFVLIDLNANWYYTYNQSAYQLMLTCNIFEDVGKIALEEHHLICWVFFFLLLHLLNDLEGPSRYRFHQMVPSASCSGLLSVSCSCLEASLLWRAKIPPARQGNTRARAGITNRYPRHKKAKNVSQCDYFHSKGFSLVIITKPRTGMLGYRQIGIPYK